MSLGDPKFGPSYDSLVALTGALTQELRECCDYYDQTPRPHRAGVPIPMLKGYELLKRIDAGELGAMAPAPPQWVTGVLHSEGFEGVQGLLVPREGETPEQCIEREECRLDAPWRLVRIRRPIAPVNKAGFSLEDLVDRVDQWLQEGREADWHGPYSEQVVVPAQGARTALTVLMERWAAQYLSVRLWEIHPDDLNSTAKDEQARVSKKIDDALDREDELKAAGIFGDEGDL